MPSHKNNLLDKFILCVVFALLLVLQGCVNMQTPASPDPGMENSGVKVLKRTPDQLPTHMQKFEDTQFLVVQAKHASEFGVGMLVPIPFVTDAAFESTREKRAGEYNQAYTGLSPYLQTLEKIESYDGLYNPNSEATLYPMVIMTEGDDDIFRISLFYQVQLKDWMGRYFYHFQTAIPSENIAKPTEEQLAAFRDELTLAVSKLLPVVKSDLANELPNTGALAVVGSRYIVGGKVGGLVSPELIKMKNVEVLEEAGDSVLLRAPGNLAGHADDGGFWFGIHYFMKDQLFYYEKNR